MVSLPVDPEVEVNSGSRLPNANLSCLRSLLLKTTLNSAVHFLRYSAAKKNSLKLLITINYHVMTSQF